MDRTALLRMLEALAFRCLMICRACNGHRGDCCEGVGESRIAMAAALGDGLWSLILSTLKVSFIVLGGDVVASSPPVARLIKSLWQSGCRSKKSNPESGPRVGPSTTRNS
jgi:short subunit fatty acids transporter